MTTKPNQTAEREPRSGNGLLRELARTKERCAQLRSRVAELEAGDKTTLRDQLAMAALQGLVSTLQYHPDCGLPCHQGALTDDAYKIADAAIKVRNQHPAEPK